MKILDVYGFRPNGHSSSPIDEEGARAPRETTAEDRLSSDGGYSIGRKRGDRAKQSAATSRSFESDSNVTAASDLQSEKQDLQSTSTDEGI
jgi:hypothetical protein